MLKLPAGVDPFTVRYVYDRLLKNVRSETRTEAEAEALVGGLLMHLAVAWGVEGAEPPAGMSLDGTRNGISMSQGIELRRSHQAVPFSSYTEADPVAVRVRGFWERGRVHFVDDGEVVAAVGRTRRDAALVKVSYPADIQPLEKEST